MSSKNYQGLPKASKTYAKIVKSLLPVGKKATGTKNKLPEAVYTINQLTINKSNLNKYRKICGFYDNGNVPITYFAVLSQSLQMNMMVDEPFPFAMLGLVHVENSVTQYRHLLEDETFSLSVTLDNLRPHDKGQQFDFVTKVKVADELVWEGTSTYLARSKTTTKAKKNKQPTPKMALDNAFMHRYFSASDDIGRRYAAVSGDFNLIHIHPITAKALGFPTVIAHGMWSKAKILSQMQSLPPAYKVDVSFKLPVLLPAKVELIAEKMADNNKNIEFGLYNAKNDKPHLTGTITSL